MFIKPTLFIGIGTSGTEIIQQLRRHVFEEFQVAALPCFSYIAIETNVKNSGEDKQLPNLDTMQLEEKIQTLHIGLPDVSTFRKSLQEVGADTRWGDIRKWLAPQLLDISPSSFEDGASNTRMIGRLCLWYNWKSLTRTIQNIYDRINNTTAKDRTKELVARYLKHKNREKETIEVSSHCDVYIVGTLCGGTGSGSFIDLGYFANHDLQKKGKVGSLDNWRYGDNSDVYGIFTVADLDTAENRTYAANTYAALAELDYYFHDESVYNVRFPESVDTANLANTNPYRWVDLVSRSSSEPDVHFRVPSGLQDLHATIALNLFCNVVTPMMMERTSKWSDYPNQHPNFSKLNQLGHVHRLNTFGISAFWFPKHRIAQGVAAKLGLLFCERNLQSSETGDLHVEKEVQQEMSQLWPTLLNNLLFDNSLGEDPKNDITKTLNANKSQILASKNIEHALLHLPLERPLTKEYEPEGKFTKLIQGRLLSFGKQLDEKIASLQNRLAHKSIAFKQQFTQKLHDYFSGWLASAPSSHPTFTALQEVKFYLRVLQQIEGDFFLKHLNIPEKARKKMIERVLKIAEQEYVKKLEKLRDFLVREKVEALLKRIHPTDGHFTQALDTHDKIAFARDAFQKALDESHRPTENQNVKILLSVRAPTLRDRMKLEIEKIYTSISSKLSEAEWSRLQKAFCQKPTTEGDGEYTMHDFLEKNKEYIFDQLNSVFQREALRQMQNINVAELVCDPQHVTEGDLNQQAKQSEAFLEFAPPFRDKPRPTVTPTIIAAGSKEDAESVRKRSTKLTNAFKLTVPTGFEHLLIFFREEPLFTLEDTSLHYNKRRLYEEILQQRAIAGRDGSLQLHAIGLHTDQNTLRFDASYFLNVKILKERYQFACEFFPEKIFEVIEDVARFVYHDEMNHTRFCRADSFELEFHEFAHSTRSSAREAFYKRMTQTFNEFGEDEIKRKLKEFMDTLMRKQPNMTHAEQDLEREKRLRVIKDFIPKFGSK